MKIIEKFLNIFLRVKYNKNGTKQTKISNKDEKKPKQTKNDRSKLKLKGEVRYMREIHYNAGEKFGKITIGNSSKGDLSYHFNTNGFLIEKRIFNLYGATEKQTTYKYNTKGDKIEQNEYDSNGNLEYKTIYKYDINGNRIKKNTYRSDKSLKDETTYKYDNDGNKIEEYEHIPKYIDDEGYQLYNELEHSSYRKITYEYDTNGRIKGRTREDEYDNDWLYYKYDTNGNIREEGSGVDWRTYKYDDNNNNIESIWYYSGGVMSKDSYKYDDNHNVIENIEYDDEDEQIINKEYSYEYEYDKKGNWTKQIVYEDHFPKKVIERTIEYFE